MPQRRAVAATLGVIGAALLAVSPFPDWYHLDTGDSTFNVSGWDAFELVDIWLVGAAIATLYFVARSDGRGLLRLGAATTAIVFVQLTDKTPLLGFGDSFDVSIRIGGWLALAGALLVLAAGAVSFRLAPLKQKGPAMPGPR
jgi:hypothetical protein